MRIKEVDKIRELYRDIALNKEKPNRQVREIWNTSVLIISYYELLKYRPFKNIKYLIPMVRKMRELDRLLDGESL